MDDATWDRIADLGCEANSDRAWFELAEAELLADNERLRNDNEQLRDENEKFREFARRILRGGKPQAVADSGALHGIPLD